MRPVPAHRAAARAAARGRPSRIINVSSAGMYTQRLRANDLQGEQDELDGTAAYARGKRAEVILTEPGVSPVPFPTCRPRPSTSRATRPTPTAH